MGDTIHDKTGLLRMSDEVKENFFSLFKKITLILISGNHDEELLYNNIELIPFYKLKKIFFIHQLTYDKNFQICGHFHPMVDTKFKGIRIRASCFVVSKNKIILPSFGTFTGGLNIKNNAFKGIIDKGTSILMIYNQKIINIGYHSN